MCDTVCTRGQSSLCDFWSEVRELRCVVHGDDFTALAGKQELDWFWIEISKKFQSKRRGRIGPKDADLKEIRILNGIVTRTPKRITYEADQRPVEICLKELGLEESSKLIRTPIDRSSKDPKCKHGIADSPSDSALLNPSAATKYRGIVARMNYLGQERNEIQFAVEQIGNEMSSPTQASWTRMKRPLRYLKGAPRAVLHFEDQDRPSELVIWADSGFD